MSEIRIEIDHSDALRKLRVLAEVKDGTPRALMRALNRTLKGMNTDAGKEVSARYIIKQKDIKDKLDISDSATMSDLSISMRSKGRPIRLIKFKTKPNKRPGRKGAPTVFAQVKRDTSGGQTGAFMATPRNGKTGAFVRTGSYSIAGKTSNYKGQLRERIQQLYGPGVVQMLDNEQTRGAIQEKAVGRFHKELDHQIEHLLDTSGVRS